MKKAEEVLEIGLAGPAIVSSFSENKKEDDRRDHPRYADPYAAISPICEDFLAKVGITNRSAYSYLCRRRHNHELRHAFVTLSLDEGESLRDVQDAARHADPRTTRRYDRNRNSLERHPAHRLLMTLEP